MTIKTPVTIGPTYGRDEQWAVIWDADGHCIANDVRRAFALDIRRALNRDKAHEAMKEALLIGKLNIERDIASGQFVGDDGHEFLAAATAALAMAEEES